MTHGEKDMSNEMGQEQAERHRGPQPCLFARRSATPIRHSSFVIIQS
jgi:hypothetical protein